MACPICTKPSEEGYAPFCSKRCADVDLARWLNGSYAVPSTDPEDVEKAAQEIAANVAEARARRH